MENCHCSATNTRDGSNQWQRYLKALDPSYAPIDERSIEDLLVFAKEYARQIRFYELDEEENKTYTSEEDNSWHEFFRRDMSVIVASIAVYDLSGIKKEYEDIRQEVEKSPDQAKYSALYNTILKMISQIDNWYALSMPGYLLYEDLKLAIASSLSQAIHRIMSYEEGYKLVDTKHPLMLNYDEIQNDAIWGLDDIVDPDPTIYEGADLEDKILNAVLYVDEIFNMIYGFLSGLINSSDKYLQYAMKEFPGHEPHMALFIAFLELFDLVQKQANELTEDMLNFYYRDVLHLSEKEAISDRVFVIFELAKDIADYKIAKGSALKAGKDKGGIDQVYKTSDDLVANQAKVKSLQTTFIDKTQVIVDGVSKDEIRGFYARPVANSLDGFGQEFGDLKPAWSTFGKGPFVQKLPKNICDLIESAQERATRYDQAEVGFAIASPHLVLSGGNRFVFLMLKDLNLLIPPGQNAGEIWLTGEEGWLNISREISVAEAEKVFAGNKFTNNNIPSGYIVGAEGNGLGLYLPISEQAIVSYDPKLHEGPQYNTKYPILRIMVKNAQKAVYRDLKIDNAVLFVKVGSMNEHSAAEKIPNLDGLKNLTLQNDNGLIEPDKAFDPFTAYPGFGKSLYIGSEEVFNKHITRLTINIKNTIENAGGTRVPNQFDVSFLKDRNWNRVVTKNGAFFTKTDLTSDILYELIPETNTTKEINIDRTPIGKISEWNNRALKGFFRLDNQRSVSAAGITTYFQLSQNLAPTMEMKEISISYEAALLKLEPGIDQFFHVYPHGALEADIRPSKFDIYDNTKRYINLAIIGSKSRNSGKKTAENPWLTRIEGRLLPQFTFADIYNKFDFNKPKEEAPIGTSDLKKGGLHDFKLGLNAAGQTTNQYDGHFQEEGMLSIGIENAKPLQIISLLFQFADGSAEDEDNDPPPIHWSYLSYNEWRPLPLENIVSDSTFGLQTTGIVKIEIPSDVTYQNTLHEGGLIWLQASVTEYANRIPNLVEVTSQAMMAEFVNQNNDRSHFEEALPPNTISKMQESVGEVKKVSQPFASFDGKPEEIGKEYYIRVCERLRHKGRAINTWDYEHLVLNRFASIHKVKCIPHTDPNCICRILKEPDNQGTDNLLQPVVCCGHQEAPGHVLLVPIANLKNRNSANPLQPKTSRRTLLEIEKYIGKRTSPFVRIHARNPVYEQIIVGFRVKFYSGVDSGYHLKKLNDEIVRYLTPWAFDEFSDVVFGQKVYASSIINFIEERPYVDFITDFLMGICYDKCCPGESYDDKQKNDDIDFNTIKNCDDIERFLSHWADHVGEVVVRSCNPRAILVSAPRHIIIPYKAPPQLSPCEERKKEQAAKNLNVDFLRSSNLDTPFISGMFGRLDTGSALIIHESEMAEKESDTNKMLKIEKDVITKTIKTSLEKIDLESSPVKAEGSSSSATTPEEVPTPKISPRKKTKSSVVKIGDTIKETTVVPEPETVKAVTKPKRSRAKSIKSEEAVEIPKAKTTPKKVSTVKTAATSKKAVTTSPTTPAKKTAVRSKTTTATKSKATTPAKSKTTTTAKSRTVTKKSTSTKSAGSTTKATKVAGKTATRTRKSTSTAKDTETDKSSPKEKEAEDKS